MKKAKVKVRRTWSLKPTTRVVPSKKLYNRARKKREQI